MRGFFRYSPRSAERTRARVRVPSRASVSGTSTPADPRRHTLRNRSARPDARSPATSTTTSPGLHAGALRRCALRQSGDHEVAVLLGGIHPEPGPRRPVGLSHGEQIVENRLEHVDGHEHVALDLLAFHHLLHQQGADAEQAPVHSHQRRSAPLRMRRRGEHAPRRARTPSSRRTPACLRPWP